MEDNDNNFVECGARNKFYKFFKYNGKIVDIIDFEEEYLKIFSREILKQIRDGKSGWEKHLPKGVATLVKKNKMFGIKS